MKKFKEDLQRYKELSNSTDKKAVKAYALTAQEFFGIMEDMKEKAKTADEESALFYGINDAHEVGFIRGVRYAENRRKRSGSNKTGTEPAGSAQISGEDPKESAEKWTVSYRIIGADENQIRAINYQLRTLGVKVQITEKETLPPVYTSERWAHDKTFSAYPGQQISPEIYEEMYNCLPPLDLPRSAADQIRERYGVTITGGFLMGEPYGQNANGLTFLCFGRSGGKCYFFGEVNK